MTVRRPTIALSGTVASARLSVLDRVVMRTAHLHELAVEAKAIVFVDEDIEVVSAVDVLREILLGGVL